MPALTEEANFFAEIEARDLRGSEAVYPLQALSAGRTHPTQHRMRSHSGFKEDCPRAFWRASGACLSSESPIYKLSRTTWNRIIIIKMNDLPKDADLPEEIQSVSSEHQLPHVGGRIFLGHPTLHPSQILALSRITLIQNKSLKIPTFIVNLIPII
ncbi:hypothetical protein CEXT_171041 [Caerostris extrusa]|uniref:Uncharacterized protein n=1 Tax=Caerostris extrusa TaxID=172846 RepID=A0AAV4XWP4_CAEEX|nr:hypothetical protein CEXT_171041 [Caerostris extrusa]